MEWIEVTPEQKDWVKQINVMAYYESVKIGSVVCDDRGYWGMVINDHWDDLWGGTVEEAKKEAIEVMETHFEGQIEYYEELLGKLGKLKC